jgi:hypothetical protein
MNRKLPVILVLFVFSGTLCSQSIKDYYLNFPYKLSEKELAYSLEGADTILDEKHAYYHVQSKSNDCCVDYFTFTFFNVQSGNKVFAYETGTETTASEDYTTKFYSYSNDKWVDITNSVFPFKLTFHDFYVGKLVPKEKLQQFEIRITLPKTVTDITVHIIGRDLYRLDELFPEEKDRDAYDALFDRNKDSFENLCFNKLIYSWDKQESVFKLKETQIDF